MFSGYWIRSIMLREPVQHLPLPAQRLLSFWNDARQGGDAPSVSAADPPKLREWLADISVIDFHPGAKNLCIRMQGNNVARNIGDYHARGGYLEDLIPLAAQPLVLAPYHEARRRRRPAYSVLQSGLLEGKFDKFERLILPFSQPSTGECDHFIVWVGPTHRDVIVCESIYSPPLVQATQSRLLPKIAKLVIIE